MPNKQATRGHFECQPLFKKNIHLISTWTTTLKNWRFHFLQINVQERILLGHMVIAFLAFWEPPYCFPRWLHQSTFHEQFTRISFFSSILAWRIPWTDDPGRLQSMKSQSRAPRAVNTFFSHPCQNCCVWSF